MTVNRDKNDGNFVMINNKTIRNKKLSLKAKGLLSVMLTYSENWEFRFKRHLMTMSKDGEKAHRTALKELIKAGHVKKTIVRNEQGQFQTFDYSVFENIND